MLKAVVGKIMIKNDKQYKDAKNKLLEFNKDLLTIRKKYSSDKNKVNLLSQGYLEHITQLKAEIEDYETNFFS